MTDKVLVDASFLVAQLDERDVHHRAARALHEAFRAREAAYIYPQYKKVTGYFVCAVQQWLGYRLSRREIAA
jgi:predicted nucleic acid-binding protein